MTARHRSAFDVDHFQHRVIAQAMQEATAAYWRRRADDFRRALPRPGGYRGQATDADRAQRLVDVARIIASCEHRATLCELTAEEEQLLLDEMDHAAEVHRYMRHADDAETLEQIRTLWRHAHTGGHLDVQLARHLERRANALQPKRAVA